MYYPSFSLENKLLGIHQTSFLPVEALEFSVLQTPLVYTFPSEFRVSQCRELSQLQYRKVCVCVCFFAPLEIKKEEAPVLTCMRCLQKGHEVGREIRKFRNAFLDFHSALLGLATQTPKTPHFLNARDLKTSPGLEGSV